MRPLKGTAKDRSQKHLMVIQLKETVKVILSNSIQEHLTKYQFVAHAFIVYLKQTGAYPCRVLTNRIAIITDNKLQPGISRVRPLILV